MKINNSIYKAVFNSKNEAKVKLGLAFLSSILVMILFYVSNNLDLESNKGQTSNQNTLNLAVMIPEGYVLFGFEAENYEQISSLLDPYNMVKVYSPKDGHILAQNIKVLRAPKDPAQLSFLVPVNIANYFAHVGLEYRIVLQKYDSTKKPQLIKRHNKKPDATVTYGGIKVEGS